jgi:MFS family permease
VPPDEVEPAVGAVQGAATLADLGGYPASAVVVGVLVKLSALPLAFLIDAASYAISALLLFRLPIGGKPAAPDDGSSLRREFLAGWRYLRRFPALFENTILSALVQTTIGAYLALMVVYAAQLASGPVPYPENFPLLQMGFGVGNLIGVPVLAWLSGRVRRGRLILGGFLAMSLAFAALGLVNDGALAFGVVVAIGITNMIWLIPASSLIPEQVPDNLIGRVTSWRFAIVDTGVIIGMISASFLAQFMPAGSVFLVFGIVAALATVIGWARPAIANPPVVAGSTPVLELEPHGSLPGV